MSAIMQTLEKEMIYDRHNISTTGYRPCNQTREISEWIIGGLISLIVTIASYLVGVFKIPKDNVIKFLRFAALIFGAIIQA